MPMTYVTHHTALSHPIDIHMTSYQGELVVSYQRLVETFGTPLPGDAYKTDAEWLLRFDDGLVATIYNWKNGPTYLDDPSLRVEDIDCWNIGGYTPDVVARVTALLQEAR